MRELYEADIHKPGIYGSRRGWANVWDAFRRASSRGGRGHRAAVHFAVCFGWGGIFPILFSSNAHGLLQVCAGLALLTSLLILRQRRESEATEAVVCLLAKKLLHTGVRTRCHCLISLSVFVSVCMCNIRRFYWLRELYEADIHKPGIYESKRVWPNA